MKVLKFIVVLQPFPFFPTGDRASNKSRTTTPLGDSDVDSGEPPAFSEINQLQNGGGGIGTGGGGTGVLNGPQYRGGPPGYPSDGGMNQLSAHYYQEIPQNPNSGQQQNYGNHLDEYDSPVLKNSRRTGTGPGGGRRIHPNTGSSISSSDNNSDTTYAESDINNSLRARMAALDSGMLTLSCKPVIFI